MAEIFAHSGESSAAGSIPRLQGIFIPGIDAPDIQDGFGLITPLGGGSSGRRLGPGMVHTLQEARLAGSLRRGNSGSGTPGSVANPALLRPHVRTEPQDRHLR